MLETYLELVNNPLVESSCYNELKERNDTQAERIGKLKKERDQLQKQLNSQKKHIIRKVNGSYNHIPVESDMRKAVYDRDRHRCLKCGCKEWLTIDHIVPRIKGGTNVFNNLQTLCYRCNRNKGDKYIDYRRG